MEQKSVQNKPSGWPQAYRANGNYKKRFSFQYECRQWISGNMSVAKIKGLLDRGLALRNEEEGTQKWSFHLQDIQFDEAENYAPEACFLFDLYSVIDFKIDQEGKITAWELPYGELLEKKWENKRDKIYTLLLPEERASVFYSTVLNHLTDNRLVASILEHHVLFDLFRSIASLEGLCRKDEKGQIFPFHSQKPDYFGKDLSLPLKACWMQRPTHLHRDYIWFKTGGLDENAFNQKEYQQHLRTISGNSTLDTTLQLEYNQLYHVYKPFLEYDFLEISSAESFLETIVRDAWYKSEWVSISETEYPFTS